MRALFDVSAMLAAFDPGHVRHRDMMAWWVQQSALGWASCPITQNGFLRTITQRSYPRPVPLPNALIVLRRQIAASNHEFWSDDVSTLDASLIDHSRLLGHKQITDIYLLALAMKHGGRLVTLDRGISVAAVAGASTESLVML